MTNKMYRTSFGNDVDFESKHQAKTMEQFHSEYDESSGSFLKSC